MYLVIDQGGHASRALIFDETGSRRGHAAVPIATQRRGDVVEHDAGEVVDSIRRAIREVVSDSVGESQGQLVGAGLATQRSSCCCWRVSDRQALTPIISWQDVRARDRFDTLPLSQERARELSGLRLSPHYGASKMAWCLEHDDSVRRAMQDGDLRIGPLAAFVVAQLTTANAVDPANAQRTQLLDRDTLCWSQELCDAFRVPMTLLPSCVASDADFGCLAGDGLPLRIVGGDQSLALFADGEPRADRAHLTLGTGAFVSRIGAKLRPADTRDLLSSIVLVRGAATGSRFDAIEGTVNGAASALEFERQRFGVAPSTSLDEAFDRARRIPLYMNGVGGLAAPYWRVDFESEFIGDGDAYERWAAVGESIVFLCLESLRRIDGDSPFVEIIAAGGLASCDCLLSRLASLSGRPVVRPIEAEATARGLAYLLHVDSGADPSSWLLAPRDRIFEPYRDAALAERYRKWRRELESRL